MYARFGHDFVIWRGLCVWVRAWQLYVCEKINAKTLQTHLITFSSQVCYTW
jgi:hypothetical protein